LNRESDYDYFVLSDSISLHQSLFEWFSFFSVELHIYVDTMDIKENHSNRRLKRESDYDNFVLSDSLSLSQSLFEWFSFFSVELHIYVDTIEQAI
jgi:hypothetical protein